MRERYLAEECSVLSGGCQSASGMEVVGTRENQGSKEKKQSRKQTEHAFQKGKREKMRKSDLK